MKYTIRGVTALLGAFSEKLLQNLTSTFSLNPHIIFQSTNGALKTINSSRLTVDVEGYLHFSNVTRKDNR